MDRIHAKEELQKLCTGYQADKVMQLISERKEKR